MRRLYWVYILASRSRTLYVGVTGNLERRLEAHKGGWSDFTTKYQLDRLVYFEVFEWAWEAIVREKQIKRWRRDKKVQLVERSNPEWSDLTEKLDELRYGTVG